MTTIPFQKYQATGNDFIMLDDRDRSFPEEDLDLVRKLCDRRFGIGADGLILIQEDAETDFKMVYFNSDGSQSLCGNGSRCAVAFARNIGVQLSDPITFLAYDGVHEASFVGSEVTIRMNNVQNVRQTDLGTFIDTGSPHLINYVDDVDAVDIVTEGSRLRHSDVNGAGGTNVNFVQKEEAGVIRVRTFERGVENETLSCGTGVTAAALSYGQSPVVIETKGGRLRVDFNNKNGQFEDIYLTGPAEAVFEGTIAI